VLGLCGELGELLREQYLNKMSNKLVDEAGDVLWYIAVVAHELKLKLTDLLAMVDIYVESLDKAQEALTEMAKEIHMLNAPLMHAVANGTEIANVWKKAQRDDDGVLSLARAEAIKFRLACTLVALCAYLTECGILLEVVIAYNIEKLS